MQQGMCQLPISERCLTLIKVSENAPLLLLPSDALIQAYWDVDAYSIGFGHHSFHISRNTIWSRSQADNQCLQDAQAAYQGVVSHVKTQLAQGVIDAATDFVYEFGATSFANSTLLKCINSGDTIGICNQLRLWVHVKDKNGIYQIDPGLQCRREREISLVTSGDWQ